MLSNRQTVIFYYFFKYSPKGYHGFSPKHQKWLGPKSIIYKAKWTASIPDLFKLECALPGNGLSIVRLTCALIQSRRLNTPCCLSWNSCLVKRHGSTGTLANSGNICLNLKFEETQSEFFLSALGQRNRSSIECSLPFKTNWETTENDSYTYQAALCILSWNPETQNRFDEHCLTLL